MSDCPFCAFADPGPDDDLVALRTSGVVVVPALKQRRLNRGHMLVVPRAHVTGMDALDPALLADLYGAAARVSAAVRAVFGATGATLFQNDGSPDQVLDHVHVHVVPRCAGDAFRMPDPTGEVLGRDERREQALALRRALG